MYYDRSDTVMDKKPSFIFRFLLTIAAISTIVIAFLLVSQTIEENNTIQQLMYELDTCKEQIAAQERALLDAEEQIAMFEKQVQEAIAEEEMTYIPSSTKEYAAWIVAQTAVEHTDLYYSLQYAYEQLMELKSEYYDGSIKYKAALNLLVPEENREDLSSYEATLKRYFGTSDEYTARKRFIEDLVSTELLIDEGKDYYSWNRSTLTVKNVMTKLNVTEDVADGMMGLLRIIGWDV